MDSPLAPTLADSPKRLQIARAAETLFLAQGYGAVSMDQVARTAGVSKATLYAHFTSKDRLFATIVADKGRESPVVDALFPAEVADLRAALLVIGQRMLRFLLHPRTLAIFRIAIAESARFPELGRAFHDNGPQKFFDRFRAWLEDLAAQGCVRVADPLLATEQFMALMRSGVFLRATLALPPPPAEAEIDATVAAAVETWLLAFGPAAGLHR